MDIHIDLDRICNKAVDNLLNKINPNLTFTDEERQEIVDGMINKIVGNQDDLEYTIEKLLIQRFEEQSNDLFTALTLLNFLGGNK
ncbi:hypothetical protein [Companilactobacillus farciminis]|uniref:hypothetical protein n=1 Tax=Companilactobacillus farciminis TaxID=1612 RepID=UPI00241EA4EC|nr:hypothetical protein [Companilactobacillus farciminis]